MNTRIAPSPTGRPHLGLVRTAYLNWLAARTTGGRFLLRIDDTDPERSSEVFLEEILSTLEWLGLDHDGMFRQSGRSESHRTAALMLLEEGKAYLDEEGCTRLRWDPGITTWRDSISGEMGMGEPREAVILRSDGSPTYHLASVVDDISMGITSVIRGTDHISNTPLHVQLYSALGGNLPEFTHVGLIHHRGRKLSKRDPQTQMSEYYSYMPESVLAWVLRMGWSHPDPEIDRKHPVIDRELALQLFLEGHLRAAPSTLDVEKLGWIERKMRHRAIVSPAR